MRIPAAAALALLLAADAYGVSTVINGFEPGAASLDKWSFSNPSGNCAFRPSCGGSAGKCTTMIAESTFFSEGSYSGEVYLQNDNTDADCWGNPCGSYRTFTLSSFAPTNWSAGYTQLSVDGRFGAGQTVILGMTVTDGTHIATQQVTLSTPGSWSTVSMQLQDLLDAGFNLGAMTGIQLSLDYESGKGCTTAFLDNLRLLQGTIIAAPTGVTVLPTGVSGQLMVSWTPVAGASNYCLYRAPSAFNYPTDAQVNWSKCSVGAPPYYDNDGLVDGTNYWYKVVAVDADGVRGPAGDPPGDDDWGAPTCMGGTGVSAFSFTGGVRVIWAQPTGATYVKIYKRDQADGALTCSNKDSYYYKQVGPPFEVLYDDKEVTVGRTYCYLVTPHSGSCNGPCSNVTCVGFTGTGCAPPGPIGALTLTVTSNGVVVGWNRPVPGSSPLESYDLLRTVPSPSGVGSLNECNQPYYSMTDTGVKADTNYCWQVRAWSVDHSCTSFSDVDCACALEPPEGLVAIPCTGKVRLMFTAPALKGSTYRVYRRTTTGTCVQHKLALYASFSSTCIFYDDFTPNAGDNYYRVTSKGAVCESDCSPEVYANYTNSGSCPCVPPGDPAVFTVTPGSDRVRLVWSKPPKGENDLWRYRIMQGLAPGGPKSWTATVYDGAGLYYTYTPTGLELDKEYCYQIVSEDQFSCTSTSYEVCATTSCHVPTGGGPLAVSPAYGGPGLVVTWSPPAVDPLGAPLSGYQVLRADAVGGPWTAQSPFIFSSGSVEYSWTHSGAVLTNENCYQVQIFDKAYPASCTAYTAAKCHLCNPPAAFNIFSLTASPPSNLLLSWNKPASSDSPMDKYIIRRSNGSITGPWSVAGTVFDSSAAFFMDTLPAGLTASYCYEIAAVDLGGCSIYCAAACHSCSPPGAFNINAPAASPPKSLLITWTKPVAGEVPVSRYYIKRSVSPTGPWAIAGTVYEPDSASFLDTVPTNLTDQYCYDISAVDQAGCSTYAASTVCHSCSGNGPGLVPMQAPVPESATRLRVEWLVPTVGEVALSRYEIWRATDTYSPKSKVATVWSPATTCWVDSNGSVGMNLTRTWCYDLKVYDQAGCSATSDMEACYECTEPYWQGGTPTGPANITTSPLSDSSVMVWWDAACAGDTPVSRYLVYRSLNSSCSPGAIAGIVLASCPSLACPPACPLQLTLTVTGLEKATVYYFQVVAESMTRCSVTSPDCVCATTFGGCAFVPRTPSITPLPSSVVINWGVQYTGTITGFEVWRSEGSTGRTTAGKKKVGTPSASARSWKDTGLAAGKNYCYILIVKVDPTCSAFSDEVCVSTLKMTAYPNPAKLSEGPVRFDGLPEKSTVEIYTLNGELVTKHEVSQGGLWEWTGKNDNGSIIAGGIYFYIIRTGSAKTRGKLVISR